jgi:hypothetical protein
LLEKVNVPPPKLTIVPVKLAKLRDCAFVWNERESSATMVKMQERKLAIDFELAIINLPTFADPSTTVVVL